MKSRIMFALRILLILLYICSLLFTFYQSSLPKEESQNKSDEVLEWLEPIIPSDTPIGGYVHTNIREIAHFTEFFFQGLFLSLYLSLFHIRRCTSKRQMLPIIIGTYILSPIVPLLDETLQIFTSRGPEILDVWVDTLGFVSAVSVIFALYFLVTLVIKRLWASKN